jgi:hypothetical protein
METERQHKHMIKHIIHTTVYISLLFLILINYTSVLDKRTSVVYVDHKNTKTANKTIDDLFNEIADNK